MNREVIDQLLTMDEAFDELWRKSTKIMTTVGSDSVTYDALQKMRSSVTEAKRRVEDALKAEVNK